MRKSRSGFAAFIVSGCALPSAEWIALADPRIKKLSIQELSVLCQLRKALPDKLIADKLGLSVEGVRFHLRHCMSKTGCKSRIALALFADRNCYPPGFISAICERLTY